QPEGNAVAALGSGEQAPQFIDFQLAAVVPAVGLDLGGVEVGDGVVSHAAVLDQPAAETLEMREVVVRCLHAPPLRLTVLQELDGGARVEATPLLGNQFQPVPASGFAKRGERDAQKR